MLKQLIYTYGVDKLNTLTKYPSILTLHALGEKGKLTHQLTTDIEGEILYATEKIDGTNVRIILYGNEWIVGSREFLLSHSDDLFYDPAQGIVPALKELGLFNNLIKYCSEYERFKVIYGELYGGKVSANSKWYGKEKYGFRVFDAFSLSRLSLSTILGSEREEISRWRESNTDKGIKYGQPFFTHQQIVEEFPYLELVPQVEFNPGNFSRREILDALTAAIPVTNVKLTNTGTGNAEGLVLRTADRSKIVKVRFEDYNRTLQ